MCHHTYTQPLQKRSAYRYITAADHVRSFEPSTYCGFTPALKHCAQKYFRYTCGPLHHLVYPSANTRACGRHALRLAGYAHAAVPPVSHARRQPVQRPQNHPVHAPDRGAQVLNAVDLHVVALLGLLALENRLQHITGHPSNQGHHARGRVYICSAASAPPVDQVADASPRDEAAQGHRFQVLEGEKVVRPSSFSLGGVDQGPHCREDGMQETHNSRLCVSAWRWVCTANSSYSSAAAGTKCSTCCTKSVMPGCSEPGSAI